ncbi:RagB/SusD family nutrient uptake outer membrane protein [Dokdonia sp. Asnod1-B02]|uniref:RagB/SusD family nutrient uptake outer membrane protein n=1 Tax=Dokdonia sp. Asnod1-B02 TaxID=3160573 RepID=UPI0038671CF8
MKNIITKLFGAALVVSSLYSCDDRLEEIQPEDALPIGTLFNDFPRISGTAAGMYSVLQDSDTNGVPQIIADYTADNANFVGSFPTLQDIRDFSALSTNTNVSAIWQDAFQNIRAANNILTNLPPLTSEDIDGTISELEDFDAFLKDQWIAEARFVRAISHFDLVNLFAQPFQVGNGSSAGIPIVTEFFAGNIEEFRKERASVNDVHTFIENELLLAIPDLPDTNPGRATAAAANALLARLYLYRENWENAATFANNAISAPGVALATDYSFFNASSSEHIFQVRNLSDDAAVGNGYDVFYNPSSNNGRGDLPFAQDLIDAYSEETGDLRFSSLTISATDAGNNAGAIFTTKYPNGPTQDSDPNVLRVTEMYLIRAEANLINGSTIGDTPLNDINALRERAGLDALTSVTLDEILTERRKELAFEGHRRMDLLRNNQNLRSDGGAVSAPGANKVILPIPQVELDNNPSMVQNDGY